MPPNELEERAYAWLMKVIAHRGNPRRVSLEWGFAKNWAWRILNHKKRCNWDFDTLAQIAAALDMTPIQLEDTIRAGIIPAAKPIVTPPRAKPRRAAKEPAAHGTRRKATQR